MRNAPSSLALSSRIRWVASRLRDWPVTHDPALASLRNAARTVLTVILAVLTTYVITNAINSSAGLTPALLAAIIGLFSTFAVNDPTPGARAVTMLLFAAVSACAVFLGSLLAPYVLLSNIALLVFIFLAFALRRIGPRFQPLGMGAFISFYFASLLHSSLQQLPIELLAIALGIGWGMLAMFVLLPDHPQATRARSIRTFYTDAATVVAAARGLLAVYPGNGPQIRPSSTRDTLARLTSATADLQNQLADADERGEGTAYTRSLEYFLADAVISLETLVESVSYLAALPELDDNVRSALAALLEQLERAFRARAVRGQQQPFAELLRTLEAACSHVSATNSETQQRLALRTAYAVRWLLDDPTEADLARQEAAEGAPSAGLDSGTASAKPSAGNGTGDDAAGKLDPTLVLAIQGVLAGILSIIIGYLLSPTHQYWTLLAAFVVLSRPGSLGATYVRAVQRVVGTLAGALLGFGVAQVVAGAAPVEIVLAFVCVFAAFYLFNVSYGLMVFFTTIMLALMYDILLGSVSAQLLQARFVDTLFGAAIGLLISLVVFPHKTSDEVKQNLRDYFSLLDTYIQRSLDALLATGGVSPHIADTVALNSAAQTARASLDTLRKQPGARSRAGADRILAALTATSYYARHLTDPLGRRTTLAPDQDTGDTLASIRQSLAANFQVLCAVLGGARNTSVSCADETDPGSPATPALVAAQTPHPTAGAAQAALESSHLARIENASENEALLLRVEHYALHVDQAICQLAMVLGAHPSATQPTQPSAR